MRISRATATAIALLVPAAVLAMVRFTGGRGSPEDATAAVRGALATGGSLARMARLTGALQALSREEMEGAAAIYAREISTLGECDIAPFVDAWAHIDAEQAVDGVAAWPYARKREAGLRNAVESVASREPGAGRALYEALAARYPRFDEELQVGLVSGLAASDPEQLRGYLRGLAKEAIGAPLGRALGMVARQHGVDALLAWAEQLIEETPDAQVRAKIFRKAARAATRRDPRSAAEWLAAHWGRDYATEGPSAVAEAWILITPVDAIDWLEVEAPAESRSRALELAFGRWLYEDRVAATKWLDSTGRTSFHDPALAAYARNLARRDPEEAMGRCEQVLQSEAREKCFVSVARIWLKRDAAAASAWIDDSPLDEESRDSLRTWAEGRIRGTSAGRNAEDIPRGPGGRKMERRSR